ncbi:MAG: DUF4178 domain-containing protein [Proteobacteria bacterium]|nr:DUF4178 domain-containing protein [Pseudomonadota bacterium]
MSEFQCPSCSGVLKFKSTSSVTMTCPFCTSTVVRHDLNLELLGKVSGTIEDLSPLQVGTSGYVGSKAFQIVGRATYSWDDGVWNEWRITYLDGSNGWLAEAQGEFTIFDDAISSADKGFLNNLKVNAEIDFNGSKFMVTDIKKAECIGVEGELPFVGTKGRKGTFYDLSGFKNEFLTFEETEAGSNLFRGQKIDFDNLKLSTLRYIDGWD